MAIVKVNILGIPVEARFTVRDADDYTGGVVMEDLTFHNLKNGSELRWLDAKLNKAGPRAYAEAIDAIWAAFDKLPRHERDGF